MHDQFRYEHEKREKRISPEQRQAWADGILSALPDSAGYQRKCTKESRLAEQEILLRLVNAWLSSQSAADPTGTPEDSDPQSN